MIFIGIRIIRDFVIRPAIFIIPEKCGIAKSVRVSKITPRFSKKNSEDSNWLDYKNIGDYFSDKKGFRISISVILIRVFGLHDFFKIAG